MAEKRISELENMSVECFKTEKEEKMGKKTPRISKKLRTTTKDLKFMH